MCLWKYIVIICYRSCTEYVKVKEPRRTGYRFLHFIFHHQHHQGDIFWSSYPSPSSSDALCLLVDPMEASQFIRWTTNISNLLRIHIRQFYMKYMYLFSLLYIFKNWTSCEPNIFNHFQLQYKWPLYELLTIRTKSFPQVYYRTVYRTVTRCKEDLT